MGKRNGKKANSHEMKRESLLVTKESVSATFTVFSFLATLMICTGPHLFGEFGLGVYSFFTGVLGYLAFPILLAVIYLSVTGLLGKRLVKNRRAATCIILTLLCIALIVHTALTFRWPRDNYLAACLSAGDSYPNATVTGWLGGLIVYGISAVMSNIGAIVLFSLFAAFFIYLTYLNVKTPAQPKAKKEKPAPAVAVEQQSQQETVQPQPQQEQPQISQPSPAYIKQGSYQGLSPMQPIQKPTGAESSRISVEPNKNEGVYSPFGRMEQLNTTPQETTKPQTSREILFGGNLVENFRKNGMFDPNSKANNRPMEPVQQVPAGAFTPSYTEAYQDDINGNKPFYRSIPTPTETPAPTPVAESVREEPLEPLSYMEELKPSYQEQPSYSPYEEEPVSEPVRGEERDYGFGFNREVEEEKPLQQAEETEDASSRYDYKKLFSLDNPRVFGDETLSPANNDVPERGFGRENYSDTRDNFETVRGGSTFKESDDGVGRLGANIFDEPEEEPLDDPYTLRTETEKPRGAEREKPRGTDEMDISERGTNNGPASYLGLSEREGGRGFGRGESLIPQTPQEPPKPKKPRVILPYKRVPLDDFDCRDIEPSQNDLEVEETKETIIATLEDFKVMGATIASVTFGPTVTRYNVALPRSISPKKIVTLDQSIAINLHSSGVNIYPNYEDGVVSIEVPNKERQFVQLGCMLSGNTFVNAPAGSLMFAMGKNVANAKVYGDISKMIHLLVAGSSGSGKSVFLGALIVSMIYKYSPEELRLILIDPKKTEFVLYNNLPHLMINEIITDVNKAVQSLNWAIGEMNRRYTLFEQMSRSGKYVVNLDQYNEQLPKNERLPKIVIIIDELADLMLAAKKDIEEKIQNLTQKARAAGIHLIVATQRPSADVITGVIKSNLSTRIAFAVASEVDSRVILDQSGAQKLLGKGDFLYSMPGINIPVRVQSAFISPADSQRVVNFIKDNNEAYYDEEATAYINNTRTGGDDSASGDKSNFDPMCIEALRHVILSGSASISMIQRKCSAGYNRAGKIIEWMEDMGYISPFDGARARKVLITKEQFEREYGPL